MKFIEAPRVHVVGHTTLLPFALQTWAHDHEFAGALQKGAPLAQIIEDLEFDASTSVDAIPEFGGRFCYRSFEKGRSREEYLANVIEMEHGSVFHHATINFAISGISRSLSHELVRHHAGCDPSQESQRYVDASEINFVVPPAILKAANPNARFAFESSCTQALDAYRWMLSNLRPDDLSSEMKKGTVAKKRALEAARSVLPNAAETRMLWTMNMRAARYLVALRGGEGADLEIRRLAAVFARCLKDLAPITFAGMEIYTASDGFEAVHVEHAKI